MTREQKIKVVEEYVGIFEKPGVYLMDFKGLNVAEITALRKKLREANVSMRVVKNTLAKRALEKAGTQSLNSFFVGPVGLVYSVEDSVIPARILIEFLKELKKGTVKAGIVDGAVVDENEIKAISKIPTKIELQAKTATILNAPLVRLAQVLNALPVKLARTIQAIEGKE